ncbi:MAG: rRNA maturation RNase YbeY [Micrococcaceae bacterium]
MMLEIINKTSQTVDSADFQRLVDFTFKTQNLGENVELSLVFVDEQEMEHLHVTWLDLAGPTDVMSFPMDELEVGAQEGILGDIVLCPTVTAQQAKAAGHSVRQENCLLVIHGILHLLGHDHYDPEEKKIMFSLQDSILKDYLEQFPS